MLAGDLDLTELPIGDRIDAARAGHASPSSAPTGCPTAETDYWFQLARFASFPPHR